MSFNGLFSPHRNAHRNSNAHAGTTLKRRIENRGGIGDFQEERHRYAPPQKRAISQTQTQAQTQFRSDMIPPLSHGSSNVSRVSQSYNYGDVIASNSSFALRNNDFNTNYQKPFDYGNPNSQTVPLPLPYRKLDVSFDSLPEWVPNQSASRTLAPNLPNRSSNFVPNTNAQAPAFTNFPSSMPLNHSNMASVVSQVMPQPIVMSKDLSDLLSVLNNEKEKQNSEASKSDELPLGLSFDDPLSLRVRHESVIKSLYSDMTRQCSSCGLRFKSQEEHSNHMDWHVRKNRMDKDANKTTTRLSQKPKKSRNWFASVSLWLSAAIGGTTEAAKVYFGTNGETHKKKEEEEQQQCVVPADDDQKICALCEEPFEDFFSHEADDWMYKDAVYLNMNGPIVHAKCMPETRPAKGLREPPRVMSVTVPSVASAIIC